MKPETRRSGLLVRELPDEVLVYDLEQHRAHCLNRTAALVFKNADGTRTRAELVRALGPGASEEIVALALEELQAAGLLLPLPPEPQAAEGRSRREGARRVGLAAAILLPAVITMVAPTPAEASASCTNNCQGKPVGTLCSSFGANPCTVIEGETGRLVPPGRATTPR